MRMVPPLAISVPRLFTRSRADSTANATPLGVSAVIWNVPEYRVSVFLERLTAIGTPPDAVRLKNGGASSGSLNVIVTSTGPTPKRVASCAPFGVYTTDVAEGGVPSAVADPRFDGALSVPALFRTVAR